MNEWHEDTGKNGLWCLWIIGAIVFMIMAIALALLLSP